MADGPGGTALAIGLAHPDGNHRVLESAFVTGNNGLGEDKKIGAEQARLRATYEALGWDFKNMWGMQPGLPFPQLSVMSYPEYVKTFVGKTRVETVAFAQSEYGHTFNLGTITEAWCAYFGSETIENYFGNNDIIPHHINCVAMYNALRTQGGTPITVPSELKSGDIFFFRKTNESFSHVGIVYAVGSDADSRWIDVVHGNFHTGDPPNYTSSLVCGPGGNCDHISRKPGRFYFTNDSQIAIVSPNSNPDNPSWTPSWLREIEFLRPDYSRAGRILSGTIRIKVRCPVEAAVYLNGEELNSANKLTATDWGTMSIEDECIDITLDYGKPYDIIITGTGTGTMDLDVEFDTNDG